MSRITDGLIVSVDGNDKGQKTTPPSDADYGVVIFNDAMFISAAQINTPDLKTTTSDRKTMEIVEPDKLDAYIDSMLENGWTIAPGVRPDEEN